MDIGMVRSVGTTYEGKNFSYLQQILPYVNHIEVSPDSHAYKKNNEVHIHPDSIRELVWAQQQADVGLLVHGVSLSIGSYNGYSSNYIRLLEELFGQLRITWH